VVPARKQRTPRVPRPELWLNTSPCRAGYPKLPAHPVASFLQGRGDNPAMDVDDIVETYEMETSDPVTYREMSQSFHRGWHIVVDENGNDAMTTQLRTTRGGGLQSARIVAALKKSRLRGNMFKAVALRLLYNYPPRELARFYRLNPGTLRNNCAAIREHSRCVK
jgi:hypothetical protein